MHKIEHSIDSIARKKLYSVQEISDCCSGEGDKDLPMKKVESLSQRLQSKGNITEQRRMSHEIKLGLFREFSSMIGKDAQREILEGSRHRGKKSASMIIEEDEQGQDNLRKQQSFTAEMIDTDNLTFDIFKFSQTVKRENAL